MTIKTNGSQKESQIVEIEKKTSHLVITVDYDTTQPEKTISEFVKAINSMVSRFEGNKNRISEIESEILDIEHYMELGNFKNVPDGYKIYRKLAELRRERRACKNENDLLLPVYQYFHATEVLKRLSAIQGDCAKMRNTVDGRAYSIRTDILDEWLDTDKKTGNVHDLRDLLSPEALDEACL